MNANVQENARRHEIGTRPVKLEIRNLVKSFGDFTAVNDVSFSVREGEFLTLLGGSGSGKSTILNMIAGLDYPTSGDVLIDGRPLTRVPPHKRNVGMVFQRYTLFPHMTAEENVAFPLSVRSIARDERMDRARAALKLVQLDRFAGRMPSQLSGGQQQRVAIARALVYEPEILLMDEPLGALDRKLREEIQDELRALHNRLNVTIIYVTHDQEEALRMSDTIAVMHNGVILQSGSGTDLYDRPSSRFVASFVGTSNIVEGKVAGNGDGHVTVNAGGSMLLVPAKEPLAMGSSIWIMFRPEQAWIETGGQGSPGGVNSLPVRVEDAVFLGEMSMTTVNREDGTSLIVRGVARQQSTPVAVGDSVAVAWPVSQTLLFTQ
jgi:putative spermidine/putrescine transport system ATP-binding protein